MDNFILCAFILILSLNCTCSILVKLEGPHYGRRHDSLNLNCSTDTVPMGYAADFLVNNISHTSIRLSGGKCFSSRHSKECSDDACKCSETGKWYFYKLKLDFGQGYVKLRISCEMHFGINRLFADVISVQIIDMKDPEMSSDSGFPLIAGRMTNLTCTVKAMILNVSLQWDCVKNYTALNHIIDATHYNSMIVFRALPQDENKRCTCTAIVAGFKISTSVQLYMTYMPFSHNRKEMACNISSTVQVLCLLSGELTDFGFKWLTHSFKGNVIRSLGEQSQESLLNSTTLTINSCNYQDAGEYTCTVWNKHYEHIGQLKKSIFLTVNSPPIITLSEVHRYPELVILVVFYSPSDDVVTSWLHDGISINNSTVFIPTQTRVNTSIQFYNRNVVCECFISKLFVKTSVRGRFEVKFENVFGEISSSFTIEEDAKSFNIRSMIWILTAIGIFMLTTTVTVALTRQFSNIIHIVGPHENSPGIPIYHSAPQSHNDDHTYDRTNPQYLELTAYETRRIYADSKEDNSEDSSSVNSQDYEEIV